MASFLAFHTIWRKPISSMTSLPTSVRLLPLRKKASNSFSSGRRGQPGNSRGKPRPGPYHWVNAGSHRASMWKKSSARRAHSSAVSWRGPQYAPT